MKFCIIQNSELWDKNFFQSKFSLFQKNLSIGRVWEKVDEKFSKASAETLTKKGLVMVFWKGQRTQLKDNSQASSGRQISNEKIHLRKFFHNVSISLKIFVSIKENFL